MPEPNSELGRKLIKELQKYLSLDLLKPQWRRRAVGQHPTFGHCYVVTEALYHLWGRGAGYTPRVVRIVEAETTHWWLQRGDDIVDGTKEQFESRGIRIPYEQGRGSGFLTGDRPSKRAQHLMDKFAGSAAAMLHSIQ